MAKNKDKGPGRPLKFKTPKQLQKRIEEYFRSCWEQKVDMFGNKIFEKVKGKKTTKPIMVQKRPYTITGMAVALGTTRETLLDYEAKYGDEFSDTIKRAKEMCHAYAEESLFVGKNPTGAIFNLKNNWKWEDKQKIDDNVNFKWQE